jgi:hypothetical protein
MYDVICMNACVVNLTAVAMILRVFPVTGFWALCNNSIMNVCCYKFRHLIVIICC